mmetsp:Transcript_17444/g.52703  ORF Transcript_17444/g.52703 Transcript_17444/m.52703 type:complete len:358 (-) Transcript_17444:75-1148(-)
MWWRLALPAFLVRLSCATYKGFVNPLKHYNPETGGILWLNLSDSEPAQELLWAIQDFDRNLEEYFGTVKTLAGHRVGRARCQPTLVDTQNLWPTAERLQGAGFALEGRYVNVGAADGQKDDPVYEYAIRTNATGIAVDRDPARCELHRRALPLVRVECSEVTPQNVEGLVAGAMAPPAVLDILKVDIDSYDCPVLEVLLRTLSAKIVLVEANPSIPPPYQWAMLHHPELWEFFNGFSSPEEVPIRGCSLAYEVDLLRRHGYDFIAFGGHDAVFTHQSVRSAWLPMEPPVDEFDCYLEAFIAANGIPISLTRRWFFELNDTQQALPEIWDFFVNWMREHSPRLFPFALRGSWQPSRAA